MSFKNWPRGAVILVAVIFSVMAGIGACTHYAGPIDFKPKPKPSPVISVLDHPALSDVWEAWEQPAKSSVAGLELPPTIDISGSRRFITVAAKCDSKVRWLVRSETGKTLEVLESKLTNSIMIFPALGVDDSICIEAYTTQRDGSPSDTAITFIRIKQDQPPPTPQPTPPTPQPTPGQKVSKLHVTFLLDYSKQTQAIAEITSSKELREWLRSKGHKVHELSIKEDLDAYGLKEHVKGKYPPLLVLQAQGEGDIQDGIFLLAEPLTSAQQVKDAVTKTTK